VSWWGNFFYPVIVNKNEKFQFPLGKAGLNRSAAGVGSFYKISEKQKLIVIPYG
jgi:hypothetical protein